MRRIIKLWNKYDFHKCHFSNSSTEYEVLPYLVPNDVDGNDALLVASFDLGIKLNEFETLEPAPTRHLKVTHAAAIRGETKPYSYFNDAPKQLQVYLALINIGDEKSYLPMVEDCSGKIDSEMMHEIINNQDYSIRDIIELDGNEELLIEDWNAFHYPAMLGYQDNFDILLKDLDIDDHCFDDEVFQCGECGAWDHNDDGYTYNYRVVGCDLLGTNCGCAHEAMVANIDDYVNDSDKCVECEVVESLDCERLEVFIGGMVDGRGGYFRGYGSTREGDPKQVLREYQEKMPETDFFFVHEESGQFQTYFSIYKLNKGA